MIKVITYGTFDLFHFGHRRLLERAKALGDYLIVGITADGFDQTRGKINVRQSLMERMNAVQATGLADQIVIEEYKGQKIDDIQKYGVDIFAIGSDWNGYFDYLKQYCKVVYLERTAGISSTDIRAEQSDLRIGIVGGGGELNSLVKFERESRFVNGVHVNAVFLSDSKSCLSNTNARLFDDYSEFLDSIDAVYLITDPHDHYDLIKDAISAKKHVLCESPICMSVKHWHELKTLAEKSDVVLMDAIRTAYSMAYYRMLLLVKSGRIGKVVSVDASCSSIRDTDLDANQLDGIRNSICAWGPNALLPVFQILGVDYRSKQITSKMVKDSVQYDTFSKVSFIYEDAVASIKVAKGVKTEGELVVSGTTGYIYVPAPWWKMDYFEIRREDTSLNRRYFYQLEGEGIRYEILSFLNEIMHRRKVRYIDDRVSEAIVRVVEDFYCGRDLVSI